MTVTLVIVWKIFGVPQWVVRVWTCNLSKQLSRRFILITCTCRVARSWFRVLSAFWRGVLCWVRLLLWLSIMSLHQRHTISCSVLQYILTMKCFFMQITVNYIELFDMQTEDIKSYNGKLVRWMVFAVEYWQCEAMVCRLSISTGEYILYMCLCILLITVA